MVAKQDVPDLFFSPVDPIRLYQRLAHALGVKIPGEHDLDAGYIVRQGFPVVSSDSERFRDEYLLREVLRKYPKFDLGINTRQAAIASFLEDERLNAETNDRLNTYTGVEPHVRAILYNAACKTVKVLGKFRWDWWFEGLRFGPGATTRLSSERAGTEWKLRGIPHVPRAARALMEQVISLSPHWAWAITPEGEPLRLVEQDADRFETVLKNAQTDRTIGVPVDMGVLGQLGVGTVMRRKMAPWGINLNDQSINQLRAREASVTGKDATVDAKSASNSKTCALVWHMIGNHNHDWAEFDPTWYRVLEALRSTGCTIDGEYHEYELFSSMGNGYTFELESLIFWALARACCSVLGLDEERVTVYGDDLVVPSESTDLLYEVMNAAGFRINTDKSFSNQSGPFFRESCGGHYLNGVDVTPFYVDSALDTPETIILCANNLHRWATRDGWRDGRVLPVITWLLGHLSNGFLEYGIPMGEQNDGIILDFDQVVPVVAYQQRHKHYVVPLVDLRKENDMMSPREEYVRKAPLNLRADIRHMEGYRVKTFEVGTRLKFPSDDDGYMVWLYQQSYSVFSPVSADAPSRDRMNNPFRVQGRSRVVAVAPSEASEPYKTAESRTKGFLVGKRVVSSWPYLGPWVSEDQFLQLGRDDLLRAINLSRSSGMRARRVVAQRRTGPIRAAKS